MLDAVNVLGQLPGLKEADPVALRALAEQFDRALYTDGQSLCEEGDPAETLYVLASGQVEVRKRSISGNEHTVATLTAPCLFGHVGVLSLAERTAGIRAKGQAEVLLMSARRARVIMRTGDFAVASPFRRALIVAMCSQLANATASVASLAVDSNVADEWRDEDDDDRDESEDSILPDDAEERLLKGISQV